MGPRQKPGEKSDLFDMGMDAKPEKQMNESEHEIYDRAMKTSPSAPTHGFFDVELRVPWLEKFPARHHVATRLFTTLAPASKRARKPGERDVAERHLK